VRPDFPDPMELILVGFAIGVAVTVAIGLIVGLL
jgi:hypothetical protein